MKHTKKTLLASLDAFTRGYLACALWSSTEENGDPLDAKYGIEDFSAAALAKAIRDCARFQAEQAADLALVRDCLARSADDTAEGRAGHNFWLNRNGHGSGFWDEISQTSSPDYAAAQARAMAENDPIKRAALFAERDALKHTSGDLYFVFQRLSDACRAFGECNADACRGKVSLS